MKCYRVFLIFICLSSFLKGGSFSCPNPETIDRLSELQQCVSIIKSKVCDIQEIVINIIDDEGSCVAEISQIGEILCSKIENLTVIAEVSGLEELISASDVFLCSKIDEVEELISASDVLLCSKIENITVTVEVSGVEELISASDVFLCSKIDNIDVASGVEELISASDVFLCSKIENITVTVEISGVEELISASDVFLCSKIEDVQDSISETDVLICSKIGSFADDGSCLDSLIDVPQDINDLNLNVIQLLKTILLELRGCNNPC